MERASGPATVWDAATCSGIDAVSTSNRISMVTVNPSECLISADDFFRVQTDVVLFEATVQSWVAADSSGQPAALSEVLSKAACIGGRAPSRQSLQALACIWYVQRPVHTVVMLKPEPTVTHVPLRYAFRGRASECEDAAELQPAAVTAVTAPAYLIATDPASPMTWGFFVGLSAAQRQRQTQADMQLAGQLSPNPSSIAIASICGTARCSHQVLARWLPHTQCIAYTSGTLPVVNDFSQLKEQIE